MASRLRIPLFAAIFFSLVIPKAFSDGKVHVEGQFTFPFSSKKSAEEIKTWSGKVIGISDGDTRLYGIDTPEKGQAFGKKAKQFTSSMVYGKTVDIEAKDIDRYGRTVGMVYVNGESLNEALVNNGYAWVYRKYCKEVFCNDWISLESAARYGKIGLWSAPNPIPPWDFRHKK